MSRIRRLELFIAASLVTATVLMGLAAISNNHPGSLWAIWVSSLSAFYIGGTTLDYLNEKTKTKNDLPAWMKDAKIVFKEAKENVIAPDYFLKLIKEGNPDKYQLRYNFRELYAEFVENGLTFRTDKFSDEDEFFEFRQRLDEVEIEKDKQNEVRGP